MPALKHVRQISEYSNEFELADGRRVIIEVDDEGAHVKARAVLENKPIGHMDINSSEDADGSMSYQLVWAYLDKIGETYKHHGIGRQCLKCWHEVIDEPLGVSRDTGQRRSDGSHPTQDAVKFNARMVEEGWLYYIN